MAWSCLPTHPPTAPTTTSTTITTTVPKRPFPLITPPAPSHQPRVFYTTDNVQSKPAVGSGTSSHLVYAGSWDGFLYAVRFCARTGVGSACTTNPPTHVPTNPNYPPPFRSMLTLALSNGSGCSPRRRGIQTILARGSMRRLPSPQMATSSSSDHTTGEPTLVLECWVLTGCDGPVVFQNNTNVGN